MTQTDLLTRLQGARTVVNATYPPQRDIDLRVSRAELETLIAALEKASD